MSERFSDYSLIGELTVTPDDLDQVVGAFSIGEDHDTIWIRVTQVNDDGPWPFSYGILSWKTAQGYELGSVKAYGELAGEVYRLGVGRTPQFRDGSLTFDPRSFNLAWVKTGYPWTLRFEAASGQSSAGQSPGDPAFGIRATLGVLADLSDTGVSYAITDSIAKILLS